MISQPLLVLDGHLRVITANRIYYATFQQRPRQIEGEMIHEIGEGAWDNPELRERLAEVGSRQGSFDAVRVERDFPTIGRRTFLLKARRLASEALMPTRILVMMDEISSVAPGSSSGSDVKALA